MPESKSLTKGSSRRKFLRSTAALVANSSVFKTVLSARSGEMSGVERSENFNRFESELGGLRDKAKIPGMSTAVLSNGRIVWHRSFGYADIHNQIPASSNTPYALASVSKPFAAVIIMQLVEQGSLRLDAPMASFQVPKHYREKPVLIRHVLNHTSDGNPGDSFKYDGDRYADLTIVIEQVARKSYPRLLETKIFRVAGMNRSVPGQLAPGYERVICDLARPYEIVGDEVVTSGYPVVTPNWDAKGEQQWLAFGLGKLTDANRRSFLGRDYTPLYGAMASSGLISTVMDLAKFDLALDRNVIVTEESKQRMFTATISNTGLEIPYGLGWFVQHSQGVKLVWHYGQWSPTISSLYIKVPEKRITFIGLATTDRLCTRVLDGGDLMVSPFARAFLDRFVF